MSENRRRGARISGPERTKMARAVAAAYDKGHSIRTIAADLGRSYGFIWRLLQENGVQLRNRGGSQPRRKAGG